MIKQLSYVSLSFVLSFASLQAVEPLEDPQNRTSLIQTSFFPGEREEMDPYRQLEEFETNPFFTKTSAPQVYRPDQEESKTDVFTTQTHAPQDFSHDTELYRRLEELEKTAFAKKPCVEEENLTTQVESFPEPDYDAYMNMEYWTLKEVILLCSGMDPEYYHDNKYKIKKNNPDYMKKYYDIINIKIKGRNLFCANKDSFDYSLRSAYLIEKYFEITEVFSWIINNRINISENFFDSIAKKVEVSCKKGTNLSYLKNLENLNPDITLYFKKVKSSPNYYEIEFYFLDKTCTYNPMSRGNLLNLTKTNEIIKELQGYQHSK